MPAPAYQSSASGGTAYRSRLSSLSAAVTVPSGCNFAIAIVMARAASGASCAYLTATLNGVTMAHYYDARRGVRAYSVVYAANPASGSRTLVLATDAVSAIEFGISFFSGVNTASPIASYATANFTDYYTSGATTLASNPSYYLWAAANQERWQTISYGGQPYANSPFTQFANGQMGCSWNGDYDTPEDTTDRVSCGGKTGASGSQSVTWSAPYQASSHVFLCNIRGITASARSQPIIMF